MLRSFRIFCRPLCIAVRCVINNMIIRSKKTGKVIYGECPFQIRIISIVCKILGFSLLFYIFILEKIIPDLYSYLALGINDLYLISYAFIFLAFGELSSYYEWPSMNIVEKNGTIVILILSIFFSILLFLSLLNVVDLNKL